MSATCSPMSATFISAWIRRDCERRFRGLAPDVTTLGSCAVDIDEPTSEEELARRYHIPIPKEPDLPISYNIAPSKRF